MGSKKKNKIKMTSDSASLSKGGYLRLSSDLLPQEWGQSKVDRNFFLLADPVEKTIELRPANGEKSWLPVRRATFSNDFCKSPRVALREVLGLIGVPLPKKSMECKVEKLPDGKLVVQF